MQYRRARVKGGSYLFTLVTHKRQNLFSDEANIQLLGNGFRYVLQNHPFTMDAHVILPDHIHCIWTLPAGDADFSTRWRLIKSYFTRHVRGHGQEPPPWQKKFWEHCFRDEEDMKHHVEYIHYNPVKHGLAPAPIEWPHSSMHRYVLNGLYTPDWGGTEPLTRNMHAGSE